MLKQQAVVQEICCRLARFSDRTKMISFKKYWDFHKLLSRLTLFYCCSIQFKVTDVQDCGHWWRESADRSIWFTFCVLYSECNVDTPLSSSEGAEQLYVDVCVRRENIADLWRESPLTHGLAQPVCVLAVSLSHWHTHTWGTLTCIGVA